MAKTNPISAGAPTPEAKKYREGVIDLFFGEFGPMSKTLGSLLPNGDWRLLDRVQFYPSAFSTLTADHKIHKPTLAHFLACGLTKAFLPQVLFVFKSHHWTGLSIAVGQQGALECCHGLGTKTVKKFLTNISNRNNGPSAPPAPGQLPVADAPPPDNPAGERFTFQRIDCCAFPLLPPTSLDCLRGASGCVRVRSGAQ